MIWEWVKFLLGGVIGWELIELERLAYFKQWGLIFRSSLVAGAWVIIAIFAISSGGGRWASGLVLGLGLHLVVEFWRGQLVWPVKRQVSETEQKIFGYGLTLIWIILVVWVL